MKRWAILLLSLVIVSCGGVPKEYLENDATCQYDDPIFTVTLEEMSFDVKKYDSILSAKDITIVDNDVVVNVYWKLADDLYTNKQTNITKWIDFDNQGRIKRTFFEYENGDVYIGKETFYNERGAITQVIDHEAGYQICWAEAIAIVQKRLRRKLSQYDKVEFIVARNSPHEFPGKRPVWAIGIAPTPDDTPDEATYYQIDGVTGKYIGKYKLVMVEY